MVRAANTGISAVIDPVGRIVARLGLGVEGVLDSGLPAAIAPTIYARIGDIPAAIMVAAALLVGASAARCEAKRPDAGTIPVDFDRRQIGQAARKSAS